MFSPFPCLLPCPIPIQTLHPYFYKNPSSPISPVFILYTGVWIATEVW